MDGEMRVPRFYYFPFLSVFLSFFFDLTFEMMLGDVDFQTL